MPIDYGTVIGSQREYNERVGDKVTSFLGNFDAKSFTLDLVAVSLVIPYAYVSIEKL